jgi:hypothetical protein
MANSFKQTTTADIISNGFTFGVYLWSTPANWTNGVPGNGAAIAHNIKVAGNPSGYDDISGLYLDSLTLSAGQVAVGGSLEIGAANFGTANFPSIFSDTLLGSSAATLVVDGFSGSNFGEIGAFGSHALTIIQSATDTGGETYQVDDGGELVLDPTPQYNSSVTSAGYFYENSVPSGTFAFRNPSSTIAAPLGGVAIGDSIALPGSDVSSVTFGASSITVVTNLGTTTFSSVGYSGTHPTGYTLGTDPTGLQRITFASQQDTSFQQSQTTQIIGNGFTFGVYLWSTAANWTNGVPAAGAGVTHNVTVAGNPSGYDDIADMYLDTVTVNAGQIAVGGSLEIGVVSFGTNNFPSIFSDTLLGSSAATLVVDGFSGANFGEIGAFGSNALTIIQSTTDTGGEIYQVDDGGELVLIPIPQYNPSATSAGYFYENSVATGTFAFRNPSGTITAPLGGVAIGDSIALPGSDVSSVTFGTNFINIVTNLGTTTFSNVGYSSTRPTGYTLSADPTGLQRITFTGQQATSFQQSQTTQIISNGFTFGVYLWSTAANWTNGVPSAGAGVTHNITVAGNPSGYDDISGLYLDSAALNAGQIAVGGSLEIGVVSFGTSNFPSIFSDTLLGSSAATLVVDGFSGANFGEIGAFGSHALTVIQSGTDTGGETYQVDDGGELVLNPIPQYNASATNAGYFYENSVATGTFAFRNPSGTITAPLAGVAIGDSIALPGSDVSSVTFGANSIRIVTNLGTTTFSSVGYSSTHPTGYTVSADPTGLQRITFASQQGTSFQQSQTTQIINNGFTFGLYLWSTASNWTNGAPGAGAAVTHNITVAGNPSGYDDIASLYLDTLAVNAGQIAVGGSLEIGVVSFGTNNFPSIFSDTLLGSSAATLVVDGFSGSNFGEIGAFGSHALTIIQSATDTGGETYQVDDGGELVLDPIPQYNSSIANAGYFYENSVATGTFAFRNPSGTITAPLGGVAIGDSIALPGSDVSSVTYGTNSITIATNQGTTTFSNVGYAANEVLTGYTAAADPISGLERVTFEGYVNTNFQQSQTTQVVNNGFTFGVYDWSNAANWINGVPTSGEGVIHNVTVAGNPSGYDDIASLNLANVVVTAGQIAVGGSLQVGTISFGTANFPSIFSDTLLGSSAATLVVDGFSGSNFGEIGAFGTHALTVIQSATDTGGETYQVDDGGELLLDPIPQYNTSVTGAGFFYENSVATGTFAFLNPGGTITAPLAGVAIGDAIALPGTSVASVNLGPSSIAVVTNVGTTVFSEVSYSGAPVSSFSISTDPQGLERITFLCFCAGTLIRTPDGDVPVEQLAIGDIVVTASGVHRPITWIGMGRVLATRGKRNAATPVIIRKGALADAVPNRDLRVTKGHSLYLDGVLIPVEFLVNHRSILWDDRAQEVSIYHVELATHDVLIANGAPAESYRDDGNRWLFQNANTGWGRAPQGPCAPLLTGGELVDAIWRRLLDRAGPRPGTPLTDDPGLHLIADGARLNPTERRPDMYVFRFSMPPRSLRLVSRTGAPQELGLARDPRLLGVAIRRLVLAQGRHLNVLEADDAVLMDGYHEFEPEIGIRWTNGDAAIPSELFAATSGASTLMVYLGAATRYEDAGHVRRVA